VQSVLILVLALALLALAQSPRPPDAKLPFTFEEIRGLWVYGLVFILSAASQFFVVMTRPEVQTLRQYIGYIGGAGMGGVGFLAFLLVLNALTPSVALNNNLNLDIFVAVLVGNVGAKTIYERIILPVLLALGERLGVNHEHEKEK
jgi:hypothetical protein